MTLPLLNYRFRLDLGNIGVAKFSECTGLGSSTEVIEYREGNDQTRVRKFPGATSYPDIVLKNAVTASYELFDWHVKVRSGVDYRQDGSIIMLDETGADGPRWNFRDGWPSKWEGPALNATGKEVAIQTLTISYEHLERQR